ncbi:glycerol-3-phosphate regulon repressor [Deinococcus piscis]|uniref:Glycerol-3-phosphate regulon repressor n=1 Tax=Deinococcus piscis TaxID=394230 RepID=A0ABQ3K3Q6_9DEIO|nr:DeoR/GlpR family DNA-binding transcription regulator [Deinococcus piscis]GHF93911.1 glycerol-3-phosphate regulon repressor [Deinococcus piscis]
MSHLHAQERHQRIMQLLRERGFMKTQALIAALGASGATVRRDLEALAAAGQIDRVHGGASPRSQDIRYLQRQRQEAPAKARLAAAALGLLRPGQTVYLDAGTTARAVARALKRRSDLTRTLRVVTHGIDIAYDLNGECDLYVVGGEVYGSTYSLTGPDAISALERYRYDLFFVGCTSIDPQRGPTNSNLTEAHQKAAIMARSDRSVLIADGQKWGAGDFAPFARFEELSGWVTDQAPAEARAAFEAAGAEVVEAGPA